MKKLSNILSCVSGEHFVAAELSRRGYIASLTSKNTKGIDILASNSDASKAIGIQVKTNQGTKGSWMLSEKNEEFVSDNLFYVFVNLNGINFPEYHIVPGHIVTKQITSDHQEWLDTPGKHGLAHNNTTIRQFTDKGNNYLNRWDLLGLEK